MRPRNHISVGLVENGLGSRLLWVSTRGLIMQTSSTNVASMGMALERAPDSFAIIRHSLERSPTSISSVGKLLARGLTLPDTNETMWCSPTVPCSSLAGRPGDQWHISSPLPVLSYEEGRGFCFCFILFFAESHSSLISIKPHSLQDLRK